jgi:ABC-type Na+ transport system ATPase subunit NatA
VVSDPIGVQAHMGVLPDARGLYPRLTTVEHIEYFGRLHGIDGVDLTARTKAMVTRLDLHEIADRRVSGFSQGERTKVALARALVHEPRNVILDEPTNGLDVMSTRAVRELIRDLRREGRCVLFSSHIMQEVSALCDRIVVIAQGKVMADGTPDELRELTGRDSLEDAFVAEGWPARPALDYVGASRRCCHARAVWWHVHGDGRPQQECGRDQSARRRSRECVGICRLAEAATRSPDRRGSSRSGAGGSGSKRGCGSHHRKGLREGYGASGSRARETGQ